MTILEAKEISHWFGKKHILKNITLEIKEGEFISIMGKSGVGKTTLIKILAALLSPSKGNLFYKQRKVGFFKQFYRKNIAFVFQDYKLLPHLSVWENISLPLRIRNKENWRKKVDAILETVGISHLKKSKPADISGGESQRVAIARALAIEPEIIFADEPTGNLDKKTEKEILDFLKIIHNQRKTSFVIVTHEPSIVAISDKTYELSEGKLVLISNH